MNSDYVFKMVTDHSVSGLSGEDFEVTIFSKPNTETIKYLRIDVQNLIKFGYSVESKGIGYPIFYENNTGSKMPIYINNANGVFETDELDSYDIAAIYVPIDKFEFTLCYICKQ